MTARTFAPRCATEREKHPHMTNMVKAILNAAPLVGGSIAVLIDDYIPESRQKRI